MRAALPNYEALSLFSKIYSHLYEECFGRLIELYECMETLLHGPHDKFGIALESLGQRVQKPEEDNLESTQFFFVTFCGNLISRYRIQNYQFNWNPLGIEGSHSLEIIPPDSSQRFILNFKLMDINVSQGHKEIVQEEAQRASDEIIESPYLDTIESSRLYIYGVAINAMEFSVTFRSLVSE